MLHYAFMPPHEERCYASLRWPPGRNMHQIRFAETSVTFPQVRARRVAGVRRVFGACPLSLRALSLYQLYVVRCCTRILHFNGVFLDRFRRHFSQGTTKYPVTIYMQPEYAQIVYYARFVHVQNGPFSQKRKNQKRTRLCFFTSSLTWRSRSFRTSQ